MSETTTAVALAPAKPQTALAPAASEAAALIAMIERAAADPNIDIDRIERMYAMYERAAARNARAAYDAAMAAMAPELPVIAKNGAIKHGDKLIAKYALWEDVVEQIMPVLTRHGFSISFRIGQTDRITVTGILAHRDGHREETQIVLPIDTGPGRNAVQAVGSSISYGKRYTASALLNLVARGEDDDGRGALPPATISEQQAKTLTDLIKKKSAPAETMGKFCEYFKIAKLADLKAADYERAVTALKNGGR